MSTTAQSPIDTEQKQQDTYSGKDDQKQQAALLKKQTKQSEAPVDSGSSLIGGTIAAVQHAVDRGIDLLPAKLQGPAHSLEETAKHALEKASDLAAPVVEAYQHDGIIAAAKTAGGVGKQVATDAAATLKSTAAAKKANKKANKADADKPELEQEKTTLKQTATDKAANLKQAATEKTTTLKQTVADKTANLQKTVTDKTATLQKTVADKTANLQASAIQLKDQATGAALTLKEKVLPSGDKSAAASAEAPKKHGRRRRGGRGHGNRKHKTRVLAEQKSESIADTLGDKAKELKDIVVEHAPASASSSSSNPGLVSNIRSNVSNIATNISSKTSGLISGASSTASGLVTGAQDKLTNLTSSAKSAISETTKASNLERKPELRREAELPALGSPMTPDDSSVVTQTSQGKLAAKPADQSSLLDKAKFAVGGVIDATRDFVADKLDNASMNADDNKPIEGQEKIDNKTALKQATKQLDNLKQAVKKQ